ncbi:LysR family transcriptional regulator [Superficieibacter sp.]|uniref:LysR family transcriptional regulator n=1 Tax=Superficieibacter sp. TaxID=2303322 RepID=UPI0028AA9A90|nr:LysR family transcriptional regulator [Superficieibacter sp.]
MSIFTSKKMMYFITTMQERNYSRAAEKLYITRSPLTKIISEMEALLGHKLFTRKHNELEPTQFANELFSKINGTYTYLREVEEYFISLAKAQPQNFIFDYSVPHPVYEHITSALNSELTYSACSRRYITAEDFGTMNNFRQDVFISLREIRVLPGIHVEKWQHDGFVLVYGNNLSNKKSSPAIAIYKDKYTQTFRTALQYYLREKYSIDDVMEHNFDIVKLLYCIRTEKCHTIMPLKMASAYKNQGLCLQPLPEIPRTVYLYSAGNKVDKEKIDTLKKAISFYL